MKRLNVDDVDAAIAGITLIAIIYTILTKGADESVIIYAMGLIAALARGKIRGGGIPAKPNAY